MFDVWVIGLLMEPFLIKIDDGGRPYGCRTADSTIGFYLIFNLIILLQEHNMIILSKLDSPYNNNTINLTLILLMGREKMFPFSCDALRDAGS